MSVYSDHRDKWSDCQLCVLSACRQKVVLARGKIPCDVLFVGEAPGASEDVLGQPFVGPAGKLLDDIVLVSTTRVDVTLRIAFTNLVCCIPTINDGEKTTDPPKSAISACSARLRELVGIAKPRLIVCVGGLSTKEVPKILGGTYDADKLPFGESIPTVSITHPAAILRSNISGRGIMVQRCIVVVTDALRKLKERDNAEGENESTEE